MSGSDHSINAEENPSQEIAWLLERASQAATSADLHTLLEHMLALMMEICQAEAALVLLYDPILGDLNCWATRGVIASEMYNKRCELDHSFAGLVLSQRQAVMIEDAAQDHCQEYNLDGLRSALLASVALRNVLGLPLTLPARPVGVVLLLNFSQPALEELQVVALRLASEIDKARQLEESLQHSERLQTLIKMFGQIGATLDRDQILRMMVDYARDVINAEGSSLFLLDDEQGDIVLHLSSNVNEQMQIQNLRVPAGKGIIGHVVETGEMVLVPDVSHDERHYGGVDQASGFTTRAILAVPLRTRQVMLGSERGMINERVIGGFEAVNKILGTFNNEDGGVLTTLANQAATVLEIANLYGDATQLFLDVIKALAAAIDARDPYTEGHSQRVSEFSVEIARELGLPAETVHQVRVGSLLHDVGKIGIPDNILNKPGRLTDEERTVMKQHPMIGAKIMGQVRLLQAELPAMAEHHERLDGSGYPRGLKGEQVSLFGRIVAVADVFDAMTSDRPYHKARSPEEVLDYLYNQVDKEFDKSCIDALVQAYIKGKVLTQVQREKLNNSE